MGKLLNNLNRQLKTEYKEDAEKCIMIYDELKNTTGHVWESEWRCLTTVSFVEGERIYKASKIGLKFIEGIKSIKSRKNE